MKVISFKVNDEVYTKLRKKNKSFRELFENYAISLSVNSKDDSIHQGIQKENSDLTRTIVRIHDLAEKTLKVRDQR